MTRLALLFASVLVPLAASAQAPEEAVRDLLEVGGSRQAYEQGLDLAIDAMGENNPMFGQLRPVFEEFYATYANWDVVEPEFVALYADVFTESEVQDLIAWYKTDLGQRLLEVQPELQRRSAQIGQRVVMAHQAELQAMIQKAIQGGGLDASPTEQ